MFDRYLVVSPQHENILTIIIFEKVGQNPDRERGRDRQGGDLESGMEGAEGNRGAKGGTWAALALLAYWSHDNLYWCSCSLATAYCLSFQSSHITYDGLPCFSLAHRVIVIVWNHLLLRNRRNRGWRARFGGGRREQGTRRSSITLPIRRRTLSLRVGTLDRQHGTGPPSHSYTHTHSQTRVISAQDTFRATCHWRRQGKDFNSHAHAWERVGWSVLFRYSLFFEEFLKLKVEFIVCVMCLCLKYIFIIIHWGVEWSKNCHINCFDVSCVISRLFCGSIDFGHDVVIGLVQRGFCYCCLW